MVNSEEEEDHVTLADLSIPNGDAIPLMNGQTPRLRETNGELNNNETGNNETMESIIDDENEYLLVNIGDKLRLSRHEMLPLNDLNPKKSCRVLPLASPTGLPPPPNDLLEHTPHSSCELLPPPTEFKELPEKLPTLVITSPSPTDSSTNTVIATNHTETALKPAQKRVTYPKSVQLPRKPLWQANLLKDTDHYIVTPNVRFALKRRSLSLEKLDNLEGSKTKEFMKPSLKNSAVFSNLQKNSSAIQKGSIQSLNRNPRKGKVHVVKTPSMSIKPTLNKESLTGPLTVPKHDCGSKHNHPCICIPSKTKTGGYMCTCAMKFNQGERTCCLDTCNGRRLHTLCGININEHVEESGYHSRETGTESVSSSTRSTDQEDVSIFSPNVSSNRFKTSLVRENSIRRESPIFPVVNSQNKTVRRQRYGNRKNDAEIRPSESSFEEECSRGSIKILRKAKLKKRETIANDQNTGLPKVSVKVRTREGILKNSSNNRSSSH